MCTLDPPLAHLLTTAPSGFPGEPSRWAHLFVLGAAATQPPAVVSAWSATATYKVGDRVTRGGVTYECLVAHGAEYAGTWARALRRCCGRRP